MDIQKMAELTSHYDDMDEGEILEVHNRFSSLTEEGRMALNDVIARRGIDLDNMQQEINEEIFERVEKEKEREDKKDKRDSRFFKIFLFIGTPLIIVGALLSPERSYETLVETITQILALALILWVVYVIRRKGKKKKP